MANTYGSQVLTGHMKRTSLNGFPGSNTSILMEKSKAGIRGSTPDSEALASSDDDQDHTHRLQSINSTLGPKPTRRPSWLTDIQQASPRRTSLSGSATFSPTGSHPATPSGDAVPWGSTTNPSGASVAVRGHSNSATSFPWVSAIWNTDSPKAPPPRLAEVLPSPRSAGPQGSNGSYGEEPLLSPHPNRDPSTDSAIPFAIPLHPTLKTYRSQSYSVGQKEPESPSSYTSSNGGQINNGRSRNGVPYAGLQHRPSRPSMLTELSHDGPHLSQLPEVDDDIESSTGSEAGVQLTAGPGRTIEQLAMENSIQRGMAEQTENVKGRMRAAVMNNATQGRRSGAYSGRRKVHEEASEDSEHALYEIEESGTGRSYGYKGYSLSFIAENRVMEPIRKGQWQSSLGFGGLEEIPQSRRHSFADVPTRPTSISSADAQSDYAVRDNASDDVIRGNPSGYNEGLLYSMESDNTSYFSATDSSRRNEEAHHSPISSVGLHQNYPQYSRPQPSRHNQSRATQLYLVTFKACRADVFYVQEGTGLQVKPGDLVIVEADRGTDLGTVAHEKVTWAEAKDLKERFAEEHYQWLMLFSRHGQNGSTFARNPNGPVASVNGTISTIGGIPSVTSQPGSQDLPSVDLKPKMIKRLAQAHEIQTLRDKEGNEAKAKRVCQQKVVEHRLNMEILDAEFQMDWKKLTFYYFADIYVNFNPLVTDLFKIYKTRIWMSAINPASFVTPTAGLQLTSAVGPGPFGSDMDHYPDRRQLRPQSSFTSVNALPMPHTGIDSIWDINRDSNAPGAIAIPSLYSQPFQPQDTDVRHAGHYPAEYRHPGQHAVSPQPRFTSAPYSVQDIHPATYQFPHENDRGSNRSHHMGTDWGNSFQGLSLGT